MGFGFLPAYPAGAAEEVIAAEQGHLRVRSFAFHGPSAAPLVTVSLLPGSGPEQRAFFLSPTNGAPLYLFSANTLVVQQQGEGFQPVMVSATGDEQGFAYGIVFEKRTTPTTVIWASDAAGLRTGIGMGVPLSVDVFTVGYPAEGLPVAFYTAVVDPTPKRQVPRALHFRGGEPIPFRETEFYRAMQRGWSRPEMVVPGPPWIMQDNQDLPLDILSYWVDDTYEEWPPAMDQDAFTGGVICHGPLTTTELSALIPSLPGAGLWPIHVGANGTGNQTRFCVITTKDGMLKPLPKTSKVIDASATIKRSALGSVDLSVMRTRRYREAFHPRATWHARIGLAEELEEDETKLAASGALLAKILTPAKPSGTFGGPGDPPPTLTSNLPDLPFALPTNPFPGYLIDTLAKNGARVGVVVVARNGKCALAVAVTRAEEGYPIATVHSNIRIGSVSKPLTAMAILARAQFQPGGLLTSIKDALGFAPSEPIDVGNDWALTIGRVEELLLHRSGWGGTGDGTASFGGGDVVAVTGNDPPLPGDLGTFLRGAQESIVAPGQFVGFTANYSNWNFVALGEIASRWLGMGDATQYELAMQNFWGGLPEQRAHAYRPSWPESRALGDAPCHLRNPDVLTFAGKLEPWQYGEDGRFACGAGAWTTSIVELVRIVSSMDPNASRPPLLSSDQVQSITAPYQGLFGAMAPGRRGFSGDTLGSGDSPFPGIPMTRLYHNGMAAGGSAFLIHCVPFGDVSPSMTIGIAFNVDGVPVGNELRDDLTRLARFCEENGLWSDEDLFESL